MDHDPAGFGFADEPLGSDCYNPLVVLHNGWSAGVPMEVVQEAAEAAQNQLGLEQAVAVVDGAGAVGADADVDAAVSRMCCMTGMTGQMTSGLVAVTLGSS